MSGRQRRGVQLDFDLDFDEPSFAEAERIREKEKSRSQSSESGEKKDDEKRSSRSKDKEKKANFLDALRDEERVFIMRRAKFQRSLIERANFLKEKKQKELHSEELVRNGVRIRSTTTEEDERYSRVKDENKPELTDSGRKKLISEVKLKEFGHEKTEYTVEEVVMKKLLKTVDPEKLFEADRGKSYTMAELSFFAKSIDPNVVTLIKRDLLVKYIARRLGLKKPEKKKKK